MKNSTKESVSRILLLVFWAMHLISFTFMSIVGTMVSFYACLGFLLVLILLIGVGKHRKYVCIGMSVILLIIIGDHIGGRKLQQHRIQSYLEQIQELEKKLDKHENPKDENSIRP
jgi:hypothetical protein